MTEFHQPPKWLGELTMPQLRCLLSDGKPPSSHGGPKPIRSLEDFERIIAARERRENSWE